MQTHSPSDLDRLGDEIALLSAHLDAATAPPAGDGTRAFAPAPPGSPGGSGSIWGRPVNGSGSPAPSRRCRSWPRPWPSGSCRTPRSAR